MTTLGADGAPSGPPHNEAGAATMSMNDGDAPGKGGELPPLTPSRPTFSPEGVDLTLIRWMLAMTPAQRLATLQGMVGAIVRLRHARPGS